jgi:hypothetical protein
MQPETVVVCGKSCFGRGRQATEKGQFKGKNLEKFEIAPWHGRQARKVREVFIPLCLTG